MLPITSLRPKKEHAYQQKETEKSERMTANPQAQSSREGHELRIPRPAVRPDIVLGEPLFRVDATRLVEADFPLLHDLLDLLLGPVVESASRIPVGDVPGEIELRRAEAGF